MKPLTQFIVKIPQKFKNEISFNGGKLHLVSKFKEFENRFNYAEIVACPVNCPVDKCEGDILYFHHHVVLEQRYDIGDNLFLVNYEPQGGYGNHAIAIQDKDENINMLGDWCFVYPEEEPKEEVNSSGIIIATKEEPKNEGELVALPLDSEWIGAKIGDTIGYTKNSDYKMELTNGNTVYRMRADELLYVKKD